MQYMGISIAVLIGSILLYLAIAIFLSKISVPAEEAKKQDIDLYILTNGVHTDLVVPVKSRYFDWSKYIRFENTLSKDTLYQYVAIGWGDKGFYLETPTWGDLTFRVAMRAAMGLSSSAVHTTFYYTMQPGDDCIHLKLNENQYRRFIDYVFESLQLTAADQLIFIQTDANYGDNDAFYEAKGSYSFYFTCNTWANNGLKACGQKACLWTLFDSGILDLYRN